jgi:predicted MPP superfamily phosphohydrolase
MQWTHFLLWALALGGHLALCLALYNRLHAARLPQRMTHSFERACLLFLVIGFAIWVAWGFAPPRYFPDLRRLTRAPFPLAVYAFLCAEFGVFIPVVWLVRRLTAVEPAQFLSNDTERIDVAGVLGERPVGDWLGRALDRVPGNQMLHLHVHEKTFRMDSLPDALDSLTIAHLSDLHLTGAITRSYFEYVIDRTIELGADLIAITGDIIDTPRCLDWIPNTLGRLQSPLGVYFILGNHEQRLPDVPAVRQTIRDAGLIDLGGRVVGVEARGCTVLLAGNEQPWLGRLPDMQSAEARNADFRLLLSHSPDQIRWARRYGFDLMLAGHTHGGQVRLPFIGPIVSPSNYGVKYACGTFFEPPTLMHVTRGISSQIPLRLRCAPELTKLVLRA